jgi:hypothetical protein
LVKVDELPMNTKLQSLPMQVDPNEETKDNVLKSENNHLFKLLKNSAF